MKTELRSTFDFFYQDLTWKHLPDYKSYWPNTHTCV